jgi:hypothetical protein
MKVALSHRPENLSHNLRYEAFALTRKASTELVAKSLNTIGFKLCKLFLGHAVAVQVLEKIIFTETINCYFDREQHHYEKNKPTLPFSNFYLYPFLKLHPGIFAPNIKAVNSKRLISILKNYLAFLNDALKLMAYLLFTRRHSLHPKIAIDLNEGFPLLTNRSELNWVDFNKIPENHFILFEFNNERKIVQEEKEWLNHFISKGGVYTTPHPPQGKRFLYIPFIKNNWPLFILPQLFLNWLYWKCTIRRFNIKTFFYINEDKLDSLTIKSVLNNTPGLVIGRQRSEIGAIQGFHYQPQHLALLWAKENAEHFINLNKSEFSLAIGHTFLESKKQQARLSLSQEIRKRCLHGQNFILALFDNVYGDNLEISEAEFFDLVVFLTEVVRSHKINLIIKSKNKKTIDGYLKIKEVEALVKEKRISFYSGNFLPSIICSAADLNIGIGPSSAVMEGCANHSPGLFYWPGPNAKHALSKYAPNLIATNLIDLKNKIMLSYESSQSNMNVIEKNVLDKFNQFADNEANNRMQEIIYDFHFGNYSNRNKFYEKLKKQYP